jgi:type IV secretory pathway TraG/TraD family ATPase VirD4
MSRTIEKQTWGPQDQQLQPAPAKRSTFWRIVGWFLLALYLHGIVDPHGPDAIGWSVQMLILGWAGRSLYRGIRDGRIPVDWLVRLGEQALDRVAVRFERIDRDRWNPQPIPAGPTAEDARLEIECLGGGAYLGVGEDREWVIADRESAVMVLGPPRSGKTSAVMIPALLGAPGPAISTSTKPDVMKATLRARAELGEVWLFDPAGENTELPERVRSLRWSPVAAAASWDQALIMARAMAACTRVGSGTTNENHWTERAAALLAPMLYAAHLTDRPIEEVLRWTLRGDLAPALEALADNAAHIAADVLIGIQQTDGRERSSIFSATAGVLAAYNADATRATAANPNFDPDRFASSVDTIYITAPEHKQALCAPLIVGLLEQVRHAVYRHAQNQTARPTMLWALDEVANIAPIHDLPALVSQAGGQNLQVMIGLQDLSQARTRWGDAAADGFMSLFQTRMVLDGIADSRTLESISLALGEYDRELVSTSTGTNENDEWFTPLGHNESVSYQTHRQRTLVPGEIAQLPDGHGLLLRGASWGLIELTPWYESEPWASIGGGPVIDQ